MEWKRLKKMWCRTQLSKNKNLKSVYVTKDNVKEVQKELGFFEIFSEEVLLTDFYHFKGCLFTLFGLILNLIRRIDITLLTSMRLKDILNFGGRVNA